MKSARNILALSTALMIGGAWASEPDNPLLAERWQTRPLVVIAANAEDPTLTSITQALQEPANREAFIEREMVLYTVIGGIGRRNDQPLPEAATAAMLSALGVTPSGPGKVILVGKDGGKKMEQAGQVVPSELFALIDKMPMRQIP